MSTIADTEGAQDPQDEFMAGMQDGEEGAADADPAAGGTETPKTGDATGGTGVEQPPATVPTPAPTVYEAPQFTHAPAPQPAPEPAKTVEIPAESEKEFEDLKKLSPTAAALAVEDSAEGAAIRARLVGYGADSALDRADIILSRRADVEAKIVHERRVVEHHNANFSAVLNNEVPEIMAMAKDPARAIETAQFHSGMKAWIEAKPYADAVSLMETFNNGRDPHKVASMMKQYINERGQGTPARKPNPNDALAVPGRGAPSAPSGIGDKDDFYAGLTMKD